MATKENLLNAIRFGCAEVLRFSEHMTQDERNEVGEGERWTARDMLSHVVESLHLGAERLAADARGEPVDELDDNDALNARMIADYRARTWQAIRASLDNVQSEYIALVDKLTPEQLNDPLQYPRLQGRPIWRNIAANVLSHPLAFHIRPWYIHDGDLEYATQQAEEEARLSYELSDDPGWLGNVEYNLACHYALAGEKQIALQKLDTALGLAPNYAEFARGDPDFASLHGSAEFESLLAGRVMPG